MKRLYSLFSLLVALIVLSVSNASAIESSAIGTGTTTATAYPFNGAWGSGKCQMLVTADELSAAGVVPGGMINGLQLEFTTAGAVPLQNFQIKVATTTLEQFANTTFITDGFTVVKDPASMTPSTTPSTTLPGFKTFDFDTQFLWDGTSNLIFETSWYNSNTGGNGTTTVRYTSYASNYKTLYKYQDNVTSYAGFATTASGRGALMPNMKINYLPAGPYVSGKKLDCGFADPGVTTAAVGQIVSGGSLTPATGTLTATAPANFQISLDGTTWASTLSFPYTEGALTDSIYARFVCPSTAIDPQTFTGAVTFTGGGLGTVANSMATEAKNFLSYCTPSYSTYSYGDIARFAMNNIDNTSQPISPVLSNTSCNSNTTSYNSYRSNPTIGVGQIEVGVETPYQLNLISNSTQFYSATYPTTIKLYADINRDGEFDAITELLDSTYVLSSALIAADGVVNGTFTIPATGTPLNMNTALRVMIASYTVANGPKYGPCSSAGTAAGSMYCGETEDYDIKFILPSPANVTGISTEITQPAKAGRGTTGLALMRAGVAVVGSLNPLNLSSMVFNTQGTQTVAGVNPIANAKLYYTGTETSITEDATLVATVNNPNGVITFTPSAALQLSTGVNNFVVTYDISDNATLDEVIDIQLDGIYTSDASTTNKLTASVTTPGITQITAFKFDGTFLYATTAVSTIPPADGWTNVVTSTSTTTSNTWRVVSNPLYATITPYSAPYAAEFNAMGISSSYRAALVSPAFSMAGTDNPTTFTLKMHRHTAYSGYAGSRLTVWMNTTPNLTGATKLQAHVAGSTTGYDSLFTRMDSLPTVSDEGWYTYIYDVPATFTGATNYLLFEGGSDYYNNIHLDDISFGQDAYMAYSGYQNLAAPTVPAIIGSNNNLIGAINIETISSGNPHALNSMSFQFDGTTIAADVANAKVWYLGQATSFDPETATLVGTVNNPTTGVNTVTATTPVALAEGNNIFALTYDIAATATEGHHIDAKITGFNYGRNGNNAAVVIPDAESSIEGDRELKAPLSGTYTIAGTEQATRWYPTLSAAVSDLNVLGYSADINFEIAGDFEDASPALISDPVLVGTNHTINIYPVGAARTITVTSTTGNCYVGSVDVDGINLDGRLGRTGTENALTIQKANTTSGIIYPVVFQTSNNVVARNLNVCGYINTNAYGITSIASTNTLFTENTVKNLQYGIYATQNATTTEETPASNIVISKNIVGGNGDETAKVGYYGIYLNGTNGTTIENNTVSGIGNTATAQFGSNIAGIYVYNSARNTAVKNNVIKDVKQYSTGGYGANGLYLSTTDSVLIAGNRITDISATGDGDYYGIYGIRLDGGNVDPKIYHNTIMLSGNSLPANQDAISACIHTSDETGLDVRNNIFVNNMGVLEDKETYNYAVYCSDASVGVTHMDYNNYSVDATTGVSYLGNFNYTDVADLAAWKLATNLDAHSASEAMTFTSDLHLDGASALSNDLTCPALPEVATDIDGIARRVAPQTTQMGVDETDPQLSMVVDLNTTPVTNLCVPTTYDLAVEADVTGFTDGVVRTVPATFDFIYQWKKNGSNVDNIKYETSYDEDGNTVLNPVVSNSNEFTANIETATTGDLYSVVVSAAGKNLTSSNASLAAEAAVVILTPTEDSESELCRENQRTTLSVTAAGTITGYQWQKEVNGTWTNLSGQTSNTLTVELYDATMGAGLYRCAVIGGVNNCNNTANSTVYSHTTNLSVVDPVSNAVIMSPLAVNGRVDVCEGTYFSVVLDESAIKGNVMDYRWEYEEMGDWYTLENDLVSGNGLIFSNSTPSMSGTYRLVVIGSSLCDTKVAVSNEIVVNVKPYVTILQQPKTQIVCAGNQIRLNVKSEGEDPTYQWQKNGIDIPVSENATANLPVFLINGANYEDAGSYRCVVRLNGCTASGEDGILYTDAALVYVMQETRIITQPTDQYAILGGDAVFEVKAHAVGEPEGYMADYQWYKGEVALSDDAKYSGANASLLTVNDVTAEDIAGTYHVVVTGICGASETSVDVRIIEAAAQFTQMPASQTVCENENVVFTTLAETTVADGEISYAWHFVDANGVDAVLPTTATTLEVVANAETAGNYYVVATLSPMNSVITSNIATLTVNVAPALVTPIANVAVAEGEEATFTAEFSGTQPLQYTWYANGTIVEAATEPTLTVTAGAAGEYTYRVEVTNACGTVTSEAVLTVTAGGKSGVIDNIAGLTVSEMMPNPINGEGNFTIASNSARNANVILMDAAGKQVANIFNGTIDGIMNLRVDAANLSSGAYFLNVTVDGQTITRRVVVAK